MRYIYLNKPIEGGLKRFKKCARTECPWWEGNEVVGKRNDGESVKERKQNAVQCNATKAFHGQWW